MREAVEFSPDFRASAESPAATAIGSMICRRQPELADQICKRSAGTKGGSVVPAGHAESVSARSRAPSSASRLRLSNEAGISRTAGRRSAVDRHVRDVPFGYTTFCRTLEDHRQAFLHNGWHKILSYETNAMTREEIVRATYDVAERLNELKLRRGLIDHRTFTDVQFRLSVARQIVANPSDDTLSGPAAELANHRTMFGDDELKWPVKQRFRIGATLLRGLAAGLALEFGHTAARLVGRYDVSPAAR